MSRYALPLSLPPLIVLASSSPRQHEPLPSSPFLTSSLPLFLKTKMGKSEAELAAFEEGFARVQAEYGGLAEALGKVGR